MTSPEPSAIRSPSASTTRLPRSSIPSAIPVPGSIPAPSQPTRRPRRASRARKLSRVRCLGRGDPFAERGREPLVQLSDRGAAADRRRRPAQVGGELLALDRDVDTDPDHRPLRRARLDQDPGDLRLIEPDVVGPLDLRRAGAGGLDRLADRDRDRERQQHVLELERAEDRRVQQRLARRRGPDPATAPAPGGLLACGDHGAARCPVLGELAGTVVGRVGDSQVQVRCSEAQRPLTAGSA